MRSKLAQSLPRAACLCSSTNWGSALSWKCTLSPVQDRLCLISRSFISTPGSANRSQDMMVSKFIPHRTPRAAANARWSWRSVPVRMRHVDPTPMQSVFREAVPLDLKKALVVSKTTRYEDEARIHKGKSIPELTKEEMDEVDKVLHMQGFSVDALKHSHESQTLSMDLIIQALTDKGIDFDIVTSGESFSGGRGSEGAVQYGAYDVVISAGGDGTFLRAALDNDGATPQVGINTDPSRSRGELCADFAHNLPRHIDSLRQGKYTWVKRSRIRASLRHLDGGHHGVLEQFALNEVFVGERDPARASLLKVRVDEEEWEKHKCSGLIVSTGTGSSAWGSEAAKVNPQDVMAVLRGIEAVYAHVQFDNVFRDGFDAGAVASAANKSTASRHLAPDSEELSLVVREPILSPGAIDRGICIWQGAKPSKARLVGDGDHGGEYHPMRSIASRVTVASLGVDVNLVLDGRTWVALERGVEVELAVAQDNPLWTFRFD